MIYLLVAGPRDWGTVHKEENHALRRSLAVFAARFHGQGLHIITGDADGADAVARSWADEHDRRLAVYHADWDRLGKKAGPHRNAKMVDALYAASGSQAYAMLCRRRPHWTKGTESTYGLLLRKRPADVDLEILVVGEHGTMKIVPSEGMHA